MHTMHMKVFSVLQHKDKIRYQVSKKMKQKKVGWPMSLQCVPPETIAWLARVMLQLAVRLRMPMPRSPLLQP